jgi:amino acid adenylation domain-containing protein
MIVSASDSFDPFAGAEISHTVPLTPEQTEIWLSVQLGGLEANLAYNEVVALQISGALDEAALQRALAQLVERHEALRTTLGGDGKQLCILRALHIEPMLYDLRDRDTDAQTAALAALERHEVTTPFDLAWGPLVRFSLVHLRDAEHVLLIAAHHIICDGWSTGVMLADLGRLYAAAVSATPPTLPAVTPLTSYARDRAAELDAPDTETARAFWLQRFQPTPAALELPTDRPYPPSRSLEADRVDLVVADETLARVRALAAESGVTVVTVLQAAFATYLARLTQQSDIVLAVPVAGQLLAGTPTLVSHCVRTLPVRIDIDASGHIGDALRATQSAMLAAADHAQVTYSQIIERLALPRDPSRLPLTSVLFNVDPDTGASTFPAPLAVGVRTVPRAYDNFDWYINVAVSASAITIEWTYRRELFDAESIARRLHGFATLLEALPGHTGPLATLPLMPTADREWLTGALNATATPVPDTTCIDDFIAQAHHSPHAIAVMQGETTLTYAELLAASARLAERLRAGGIGAGAHVGVLLDRTPALLVALLGIMRSGAAYVPLDPRHPADRLTWIATDAALTACVTNEAYVDAVTTCPTVLLDSAEPEDAMATSATGADAAYVIYTSGSTGRPKGVVIEHRSVLNLLCAMQRHTACSPATRWLAVTTAAFDIAALELYLPLLHGGTVVLASDEQLADGVALARLLHDETITHLQATPSTYGMLRNAGWTPAPHMTLLVGGEALPPALAAGLCGAQSLINCYGPTETTIWSTADVVQRDDITIGYPLDNTEVFVLDARGELLPIGVPGELCIGGRGLARGYWNNDALTAERFVPSAISITGRVYRTGDRVRVRADGRLEWLGRIDFQIKLRGHRIELGEIEATLLAAEGVTQAAVIVRDVTPGDARLAAYVQHDARTDVARIRAHLAATLPTAMLPQFITPLPALPLTPNGKVDRHALPAPSAPAPTTMHAPTTSTERRICDEMARLLAVAPIGLDDDFFTSGGHSLLALQLLGTIRMVWGVEVPVRTFFAAPTARQVSAFVDAALALRTPVGVSSDAVDDFLV